jgi:hypothetical protein
MPNDFESDGMEVPKFQSGGFVRETGLALVHEGEYITPAPGSEAEIGPADMTGQGVINYYFPVEVVIVGTLPEEEKAGLEARIWESLGDALERMT